MLSLRVFKVATPKAESSSVCKWLTIILSYGNVYLSYWGRAWVLMSVSSTIVYSRQAFPDNNMEAISQLYNNATANSSSRYFNKLCTYAQQVLSSLILGQQEELTYLRRMFFMQSYIAAINDWVLHKPTILRSTLWQRGGQCKSLRIGLRWSTLMVL